MNRLKRQRLNMAYSVYTKCDLNRDNNNNQECSNNKGSKGNKNYKRMDKDKGNSVNINTRGNKVGVRENKAIKSLISKIIKGLDKLSRAIKKGKST